MQVANSPLEEGIDWEVSLSTPKGRARNTAVSSMLLLRGKESVTADVSAFHQAPMYASWNPQPFHWFSSTESFNAYEKTATLVRYGYFTYQCCGATDRSLTLVGASSPATRKPQCRRSRARPRKRSRCSRTEHTCTSTTATAWTRRSSSKLSSRSTRLFRTTSLFDDAFVHSEVAVTGVASRLPCR